MRGQTSADLYRVHTDTVCQHANGQRSIKILGFLLPNPVVAGFDLLN